MNLINIKNELTSNVEFFNKNTFFENHLNFSNSLFIIDENVNNLYFDDYQFEKVLIIQSSESIKDYNFLKVIFDFLLENHANRESSVYCIGGGTFSDLVGFACSVYNRGIRLVLIPTTLLSMADASIGGKNGINYNNIKNLIGNYYLPDKVLIDIGFLRTLEEKHFRSGLVEIIKIALVASPSLSNFIYENKSKIKTKDSEVLKNIIEDAVKLKVEIINKDYLDKSIRKFLNFGHTFGHSFELSEDVPHGFAVAKGIGIALEFSRLFYNLTEDKISKIYSLFEYFDIEINYREFSIESFELIKFDKKNEAEYINLILLQDIGKPVIHKITVNEFRSTIQNLLES